MRQALKHTCKSQVLPCRKDHWRSRSQAPLPPYMAFLLIQSSKGLGACGGFLVREDFVMTAAHCLGSSINVTLGAHNIQRQERTQQHIPVLRAIPHPDYDPDNFLNDIMLLQLRRRIRKNKAVRPVALPQDRNRLRPGDLCTVAGWGRVSRNMGTNVLQEVQLRVQRDQKCSDRFNTYNSQTQICVGNPRERKSAFRATTGPTHWCLLWEPRMAGISFMSFPPLFLRVILGPSGMQQCGPGHRSYGDINGLPPAVFTKIQSFIPWIKRTMRRLAPRHQGPTDSLSGAQTSSRGFP
ncbi:hypothetical protein U0070_023168 [Myodes glareolus]|uniref:Peptidase S1 domain-containing protein n=1 Tax=Myodes glareolus TaxID=447135 RepID=A0AAW0H1S2_MYOGA